MQGYCDVYKWTILKRTSPEVKCLHPTSSRREMCTLSVSNVIYHTFSHGAAFYTLNGKNVNVMLEYPLYGKRKYNSGFIRLSSSVTIYSKLGYVFLSIFFALGQSQGVLYSKLSITQTLLSHSTLFYQIISLYFGHISFFIHNSCYP